MTTDKPETITPSQFQTMLSTVAQGCHEHGWRVLIERERLRDHTVQQRFPGYMIARWDFDALAQRATLPEPVAVKPRVARGYVSSDVIPQVEAGRCVAVSTRTWAVVVVPKDALEAALEQ